MFLTSISLSVSFSVTLTLALCKQSPCTNSYIHILTQAAARTFYHSSFTLYSCVSTNNKLIQHIDCVRSAGEHNKKKVKETDIDDFTESTRQKAVSNDRTNKTLSILFLSLSPRVTYGTLFVYKQQFIHNEKE